MKRYLWAGAVFLILPQSGGQPRGAIEERLRRVEERWEQYDRQVPLGPGVYVERFGSYDRRISNLEEAHQSQVSAQTRDEQIRHLRAEVDVIKAVLGWAAAFVVALLVAAIAWFVKREIDRRNGKGK